MTQTFQKHSPLTVYFDGACPLCRREISWLRTFNSPSLNFIDISTKDFLPPANLSQEALMRQIHAIEESGLLYTGIEVFRQIYSRIGLGWLVAPTAWPGLKWLFDRAYTWFAKNRLRITGRNDSCTCR
ncbi:MAG: DUF393 domain-containing protein [bacterium]|nr:DUF393 domain-containing protein [bacterium]